MQWPILVHSNDAVRLSANALMLPTPVQCTVPVRHTKAMTWYRTLYINTVWYIKPMTWYRTLYINTVRYIKPMTWYRTLYI